MRPSVRRMLTLLATSVTTGLVPPTTSLLAQQRTDVIRGRVIAADSTPVASATITVVDTAAKIPRQTRTDAAGAYAVTIDNGNGTYLVAVNMLGYAPQRRTVSRPASGTIAPVDFKLVPVAAQLGGVKSVGERPKAARSEAFGESSVGASVSYQSLTDGRTGDVTGDVTAALATLPGISVTPSATGGTPTISAFGISSDQNGSVLNGMGFGAQVPRDGFQLAVVSSSYDPSRGGFAGVQTSLRMQPGTNTITRSIHGTLDAPSLQWTSPVAQQLGSRYDQQIVSGAVGGPMVVDRLFYSGSYQFSRRASGLTNLASEDPTSLAALHVSSDSVSRLLAMLQPIGIPLRTAQTPGSRQNTEGRVALRIDFDPNIPPTPPGQFFFGVNNATYDAYYLETGGTFRNNDGLNIGPTSLAAAGAQATHRDGWAQFTAAKYLPKNILNEATLSVAGAEDRTSPYLDLPSARILLASSLADGTTGISSVQVGGSSSPRSDSRTWSGELRNQTTWNTWDRRHAFSVTLDATEDGYSIQQDAGFGTFAFNSLSDFTGGIPASYSKTLTGRHTNGTGFTGAVGIGDTYNPTPPGSTPPGVTPPSRPRVQYGVRFEGNRFGVRPAYNAAVDSIFHLRTDFVPNSIRMMPMIGFAWPIFPEMRLSNGLNFGRRGSLSGGVREYRGSLSTRAIDAYTRQTGLPDAIQQLYCVGSASPVPDWRAYESSTGSIPEACAGGAAGTPLAQTTPPVALFAPDYKFYDSWRPTLAFSYVLSPQFRLGLNGTYAVNRNVPGLADVNFNPVERFTLASEGGRPVYVAPTSIVPTTGTEAWTDSRVSSLFAHVSESRTDLRGETRTLGGSLSYFPFLLTGNQSFTTATLSYNFNDAREQFRGFTGTTAGNPTETAWSRGAIARHVVTLTVTHNIPKWGSVGLTARAQSGTPFTPTVIGDINGDGYSNDRAFIFNPSVTADTAVARAMSGLLVGAPSTARTCLQRQIGTIAGRNSCAGPWSIPTFNLSISPDAYRAHLGNRGSIQLYVNNVLSGLDQALHGSNKLHGWGQAAYVDPTLLTVRGFNPTTNSFNYTVNPLFGSSAQFRNAYRSPFMLTLDVRVQVEPDRETQFLTSLMRPRGSEGETLTEQQVKARIARGFNPLDQILLAKDSLGFTAAQVDSIQSISRRFGAARDSIVTAMARYLIARRGDYGGQDVRDHWHDAGVASYRIYLKEAREAIALFTPEQRERTKKVPQLQGILTIESIKESDVPYMFRGAMSSLP